MYLSFDVFKDDLDIVSIGVAGLGRHKLTVDAYIKRGKHRLVVARYDLIYTTFKHTKPLTNIGMCSDLYDLHTNTI